MAKTEAKPVAKKAEAKTEIIDTKAAALEKAKKIFAEANKKYQEKRTEVTKAKRLIATGSKKLATLEKKIEETKDAPSKAADILIKKAADMEARAAALDAEQEGVLKEAAGIETAIEEKTKKFEEVKTKSDAELEALGVSTKATRTVSTGTTAERRAKNNFQYRLKSKGWDLNYNVKGRIESAENYGLKVVFADDDFVISKGDTELLKHPYGEGSLSALATVVKDKGEGVE